MTDSIGIYKSNFSNGYSVVGETGVSSAAQTGQDLLGAASDHRRAIAEILAWSAAQLSSLKDAEEKEKLLERIDRLTHFQKQLDVILLTPDAKKLLIQDKEFASKVSSVVAGARKEIRELESILVEGLIDSLVADLNELAGRVARGEPTTDAADAARKRLDALYSSLPPTATLRVARDEIAAAINRLSQRGSADGKLPSSQEKSVEVLSRSVPNADPTPPAKPLGQLVYEVLSAMVSRNDQKLLDLGKDQAAYLGAINDLTNLSNLLKSMGESGELNLDQEFKLGPYSPLEAEQPLTVRQVMERYEEYFKDSGVVIPKPPTTAAEATAAGDSLHSIVEKHLSPLDQKKLFELQLHQTNSVKMNEAASNLMAAFYKALQTAIGAM